MARQTVAGDGGPAPSPWVVPAVLAVIVATNVATDLVAEQLTASLILVGGAVAAVGCARAGGIGPVALGLGPGTRRTGLRVGAVAAVAVTVGLAATTLVPVVADAFRSAGTGRSGGAVALAVLVRIPFATALAEELLFRSALLGALQHDGRRAAVGLSSLAFGAWHVLPTLDRGNAVSGDGLLVVGVVLATTAAGVVLASLRLRAGSVVAAMLAHAAVNSTALTLAWALARTAR